MVVKGQDGGEAATREVAKNAHRATPERHKKIQIIESINILYYFSNNK